MCLQLLCSLEFKHATERPVSTYSLIQYFTDMEYDLHLKYNFNHIQMPEDKQEQTHFGGTQPRDQIGAAFVVFMSRKW